MQTVLVAIIPVFFIIGLGALLRYLRIADEQWVEMLNKFELYVGLPALVLANVLHVSNTTAVSLDIIGLNVLLLAAIMAFLYMAGSFLKIEKSLRNTYVICIFFGNIAYLGLPFITTLMPGSGEGVAIHIVLYVLLLFTLGIAILEWSQRTVQNPLLVLRKTVLNPLVITSLAGILLLLLDVKAPELVQKSIGLLAGSASPMALLALGIFIGHAITWDRSMVHALVISAAKLVIVPLLFVGVAMLLHIRMPISVLEAAMPLAVTPFALSQIYLLDKRIISNAVLISTLLSLVTLPLFALLAQ